jgi:deoxyribodipyrimidine photo-lyase
LLGNFPIMPRTNVFIFRRDFRLCDNIGWIECLKNAEETGADVLPMFMFHPEQIDPRKNAYYGKHSAQFLVEALEDLDDQLGGNLCVLSTSPKGAQSLLAKRQVDTVFFNQDVTPYARERDEQWFKWGKQKHIDVRSYEDYTLHSVNDIRTATGRHYEVFTPFYNSCVSNHQVSLPQMAHQWEKWADKQGLRLVDRAKWSRFFGRVPNPALAVRGGRRRGLDILRDIQRGKYIDYEADRNFPAKEGTTRLSAYFKFGCVSVREAYHTMLQAYGQDHALIRELYWREFYAHLTWHMPHILRGQVANKKRDMKKGNEPMKKKYEFLPWEWNEAHWRAWKEGKTGFPFIDAGMRQMLHTGFMHNRLRMVTAMFLTKDLHMDWREGERFFATQLVDYDPAQNNGGWQWSASTGADAQPYFRVFNPWLQSDRYDPDGVYIKQWVPELAHVAARDLHKWYDPKVRAKYGGLLYPAPIVNHNVEAAEAIKMFKNISD